MALQSENNANHELHVTKINNLHQPLRLILSKLRGVVLNMGKVNA
jgi:hypothetical protein